MTELRTALLVVLLGLSACWPGRCEGAFRWLSTPAEPSDVDKTKIMAIAPNAVFVLNADSKATSASDLVARAKVDGTTFFVAGPQGHVPAEIRAVSNDHAHSCASAASFTLVPAAPLAKGEYAVVLLLDGAGWPAVFESDVSTYESKRALVRRYRVD